MRSLTRVVYLAFSLVLCLLLASQLCAQQTASVQGRVVLRGGGNAAAFVVEVHQKWSYTDIDGRYRINDVPFGKYTMQIKKEGKVFKEEQIDVNAPVVTHDVSL